MGRIQILPRLDFPVSVNHVVRYHATVTLSDVEKWMDKYQFLRFTGTSPTEDYHFHHPLSQSL